MNSIFNKLRKYILLAVIVIANLTSAAATNLVVSINGKKAVGGATLEQAIGSTTLSTIKSIKITAGDFSYTNWSWLRNEKDQLTALTDFTITDGITSIGYMTYRIFNDKLKKISVAKLETIGNDAFEDCSSLITANFPQVTSIGSYAFIRCSSLTTANFPEVTSIGYEAFYGCTSLKIPNFPEVTSIGGYAFTNCTSLSKLTLGITPPSLDEYDPFRGVPTTRYIEIVDGKGNRIVGDKLIEAEKAYVKADIRWYDWTFISDLVTAVKLDKTNKQLDAFTSFTLKPTFTPTNPSCDYISWTSSNEKVAVVSTEGKVYGLMNGITTITAHADNNQITTCEVTVVNGDNGIFYVKETATGRGNGTNWDNASSNLDDALTFVNGANACKKDAIKQIWIAKGTYKPTHNPITANTNDRNKAFVLSKGVCLYGGFVGDESWLSERNVKANKTILSGDIGIKNNESDNCYHILIIINNENVKLDGFTITGGNANNYENTKLDSHSIENHCGGAIDAYNSSRICINNCIFNFNKASYGGGALNIDENEADMVISNCIFNNNTSYEGGAIFSLSGNLNIINSTFYKNEAGSAGGAIYCYISFQISNCIFWENSIKGKNNIVKADLGIYDSTYLLLKVFNTALQLNKDNYSNDNITLKNNLYGQDPLFETPNDGDLTLQATSPCVNTGSELLYDTDVYGAKDLAGKYRIINHIDMGAYEYNNDVPTAIEKNSFSTPTTYLYPTITNTGFTVQMPEGITALQLYNLGGKLVKSSNVTSGTYIDISTLPKGIYVVHLNNKSMKIIKK